ncbi:MAG TPA: hypothetical protein VGM05_09085 [Planctomycetaceae bacterium]
MSTPTTEISEHTVAPGRARVWLAYVLAGTNLDRSELCGCSSSL